MANLSVSSRPSNYRVIIPLSLVCILITIIIAAFILILIIFVKRLHTVTHLLIGNSSVASLFYCLVQCINYIFLNLFPWETNHFSCRWRAYFSYMTIAAMVYSYLAQAVSRLFISILAIKYRWVRSFHTHIVLILIQWVIVILIPLPALLTRDIYHRPFFLCWVPNEFTLHLAYSIFAYYLTPALSIFAVYIHIYLQVKRRKNSVFVSIQKHRANRDLELLYNIMILFAMYLFGAVPSIIYILTKVEVFYEMGIVSLSLNVAVERTFTLVVDRDIRNVLKKYLGRSMAQVRPSP